VVTGSRANISATPARTATVPQQLCELIAALNGLGPGASLASTVKSVMAFLAATDKPLVCGALGSFVNELGAQSGKKLTPAQETSPTTRANGTRAALGCEASPSAGRPGSPGLPAHSRQVVVRSPCGDSPIGVENRRELPHLRRTAIC
jgi:hypothetical protein